MGNKETVKAEKRAKKKGFRARMAAKKLEWFIFFLATAIIVVVAWPFCTVTVEAGHVGVYFSRFLGGTVLGKTYNEGLRFKLPWDEIIQYDKRRQTMNYNILALTKGGLNVNVDLAIIWLIIPEQTGHLHVSAGPDYRERVIDPAVISTVRSVVGNYDVSRLYDDDPRALQEDVTNLLMETLENPPFKVHVLIREVKLPDGMQKAISEKFVAEQNVLEARYKVLESIENYKKGFVEAETVRITQSIVNQGMSEAYLRYLGIQATLALAESDNAKLVIIGDKDGLPLILNPDSLDVSMTLPEGLSPEDYTPEGEEGARMNELTDTYNRMLYYLGQMSDVLGGLMETFPAAVDSIGEVHLPQEGQVPTAPRREDD